jgi:hypothetical protein
MRSCRPCRPKVAQEAVADKRTEEEEEESAKGGGPLYRLRRVRLPAERAQKQGGPADQHRRARKHTTAVALDRRPRRCQAALSLPSPSVFGPQCSDPLSPTPRSSCTVPVPSGRTRTRFDAESSLSRSTAGRSVRLCRVGVGLEQRGSLGDYLGRTGAQDLLDRRVGSARYLER